MLTSMSRSAFVPAELKRGPFSIVEAARAGVSRRQLRGSSWRRISLGLYVWAGLRLSSKLILQATLRLLPSQAVFSGPTAAWLHGLDISPFDPIEVTLPPRSGILIRREVRVRRAVLNDADVVRRQEIQFTSALRTVFDLARHLPIIDAVANVDMALHNQIVDFDELRRYAEQQRRSRGLPQIARVLNLVEPATESPMESRLRMVLVMAGLPRPKVQVPLYDSKGRFICRPDLFYPDSELALEYDGSTHRDRLVEDNRRQNRLIASGIRLLRFTASDVYNRPDAVVDQIRTAIGPPSVEFRTKRAGLKGPSVDNRT